jgi:pimeloyl-ACP methyl ester carboxylesterase
MFLSFVASQAERVTESTAIALIRKIECQPITTPLSPDPIATTYVHQGKGGPPILLLHGFDSSVLEFRRLLPLLAIENETWAIDLLGFGFTERIAGLSYSTTDIKTHLYSFWKNLIQQPVMLVGASMGGATAIDLALTYPEMVKKLVLLDSAGLANPPIAGKLMFPPLSYLATQFLQNPRVRQNINRKAYFDKNLVDRDAQLCAALHLKCPGWSRALIAFTRSGGYGSFASHLSHLNQPTLILWGENDKILGIKAADRFERAIPQSKLVWIENCGHVPHLEQPQMTAQEILDYRNS